MSTGKQELKIRFELRPTVKWCKKQLTNWQWLYRMENIALHEDLEHDAIRRGCIIKKYMLWGLSDDDTVYALGHSRQFPSVFNSKYFQMTQFLFYFSYCSTLCWVSIHGSINWFPSNIFYLLSLCRAFWNHFFKKLFQFCGPNFNSSFTGFISVTSQCVKTLRFLFFQFNIYVYKCMLV